MGRKAEDHETEYDFILINVLVNTFLVLGTNLVSYFGVKGLLKTQRTQREQRRIFGSDLEDRLWKGWSKLNVLTFIAFILAAFRSLLLFLYNISTAWQSGYRKRSIANVFCRIGESMRFLLLGSTYVVFVLFWLERLQVIFSGVTAMYVHLPHATLWRRLIYSSQIVIIIVSLCAVAAHPFIEGAIHPVKALDIDPFKSWNPHPTLCASFYNMTLIRIYASVFGCFLVLQNGYLGYSYYSALKSVLAAVETRRTLSRLSGAGNGNEPLTKEEKVVRKTAVIALISVVSTLICYVVQIVVLPFDFAFGVDIFINSMCVYCIFQFGDPFYQKYCSCCDRITDRSSSTQPMTVASPTCAPTSLQMAKLSVPLLPSNESELSANAETVP